MDAVTEHNAGTVRGPGVAWRTHRPAARVRHRAQDALAVMAFSFAASLALAAGLSLMTWFLTTRTGS